MAAKNPIQKTLAYIERHNLNEMITLTEAGTIDVDAEIFEKTALVDAGITPEQYKKLQKAEGELITGVTHVAGNLAVDAFKANAELVETGFTFNMGNTMKASGIFNRDQKDHVVVAVETTHRNAEFNRVASQLNAMFNELNS